MREDHVPSLGRRFWVALLIASVLGANLADLLTGLLALEFTGRMLVFAGLLAVILVGERYDRSRTEVCYWMAVVVIQAASAKLADFSTIDLGLGRLALVAGLVVLLLVTFRVLRSNTMLYVSTHMISRRGPAARPLADAAHWTAMILASTLGSTASDFFSIGLGLGALRAAAILSVLVAASFGLHRLRGNRLLLMWLSETAIRALGTAIADLLANNVHLPTSTAMGAILLTALLALWPKPRRDA